MASGKTETSSNQHGAQSRYALQMAVCLIHGTSDAILSTMQLTVNCKASKTTTASLTHVNARFNVELLRLDHVATKQDHIIHNTRLPRHIKLIEFTLEMPGLCHVANFTAVPLYLTDLKLPTHNT